MIDDWGNNRDIALFIGGPKDGTFENVRGARTQRYPIRMDFEVWSFTDPHPVPRTNWRYGTYEHATVMIGGQVYGVMADRQETTLTDIQYRVEDELYGRLRTVGNIWGVTTAPQQPFDADKLWQDMQAMMAKLYYDYEPEPDNRTDEEKLAWIENGEGKDFLD